MKRPNQRIHGVEAADNLEGLVKLSNEIIEENFPNLGKYKGTHVHKVFSIDMTRKTEKTLFMSHQYS
jgi:hypothetical protein